MSVKFPQYTFLNCIVIVILLVINISCTAEKPVQFSVNGTDTALFGKSREAQEGLMDLSKQKILEYRFNDSFVVPPNSSLQIEYEFSFPQSGGKHDYSLVLNTGSVSWLLPQAFGTAENNNSIYTDAIFYYAVPVDDSFDGYFSIVLQDDDNKSDLSSIFKLRSVSIVERFYGFSESAEESGRVLKITPFISRHDLNPGIKRYVIDVPFSFWNENQFAEISANFSPGEVTLEFAGRSIETFPFIDSITVSRALYSAEGYAILSGEDVDSFFIYPHDKPVPFPRPIIADPALIIAWPKENWRNSSYEVFSWDRFNNILIFDYADYGIQDRMLKRLAFFVEKADFRGRLAHDSEIAHLHGWNAHDYRAEDLARFFDTARKTNFPLLAEEWDLEKILLNEDIIRVEENNIVSGNGAIISIARESPDYLRWRFMVHEGFHGLYFIDEDFREFSQQRWEQFPADAKRFLISYFSFQQYDTADEYLLVNEFMAHILQQTVSQASDYFGRQLPLRLEPTWRAADLPQKNVATGTWPTLATTFTAEAQAFSSYVNQRWGLAAGRVWGFRVR